MPTITVPIEQFSKVLRERFKKDFKTFEKIAREAGQYTVAQAIALTDKLDIVDLGGYKRGWYTKAIAGGSEVGNSSPHSAIPELGRRPMQPGPPLEPILEWAKRKITPRPGETIEQAAYAIRDAIHVRGTKPKRPLQKAMKKGKEFIIRKAEKEFGK